MGTAPVSDTTWKTELQALDVGTLTLTDAFLEAYGSRSWNLSDADIRGASLLHLELTPCVATQEIGYSSGD